MRSITIASGRPRCASTSDANRELVRFVVECRLANGAIEVSAEADMPTSALVNSLIERIINDENREEITQMRRLYRPRLEVDLGNGETRPIDGATTLGDAGLTPDTLCRICAEPNKGEMMFCKVCGNNAA